MAAKKASSRKKAKRKKKTTAKKKAASRKRAPAKKKVTRKKKAVSKKKAASKKKKTKRKKKPAVKKRAARKKKATSKKKSKGKKKASKKKASTKKPAAKKKASRKKPATKKKTSSKKKAAVKKKAGKKKAVAKKPAAKKKAAVKKKPPSQRRRPTGKGKAKARARKVDESALIHGIEPYFPERDEDYMNEEQLEHFRDILLGWKNELIQEVDRTVHHMQDEASNFPDPNDRATQESEFGLELRTRDRERKLLKKIEQALGRIDDGSYGYCEETGEEIGLRRLEARPVATLCVEAQERRELAERQYRDREDQYR